MNFFKFNLSLKSKNNINVRNQIIDLYSKRFLGISDYKSHVNSKWSEIATPEVKPIYSPVTIIAYSSINNCDYFLIDRNQTGITEYITIEVFVISKRDDIKKVFNEVYNEIKTILKDSKPSLIDNLALLYIYDYEESDIISSAIQIKADVISFNTLNNIELWRLLCIFIIFIGCVIAYCMTTNAETRNILVSVGGSSLVFIISEGVVKMNYCKIIEIKDFTNWISKEKKKDFEVTEELRNPDYGATK